MLCGKGSQLLKADEGCHAERWPYESQWKQEAYRQGLPVGLLHAGHGEACEARAMPCCVGTPQPAAAAVLPQNALPPVQSTASHEGKRQIIRLHSLCHYGQQKAHGRMTTGLMARLVRCTLKGRCLRMCKM